jgi:RNA polymerase primary sigma factor
MPRAALHPPTTRTPTSQSAYFDDLGAVPRLDAEQENALAREVVRTRRNFWGALLSSVRHIELVAEAIVRRCEDEEVLKRVADLRAMLARRDRNTKTGPTNDLLAQRDALAESMTWADDENGTAEILTKIARDNDPEWSSRVQRARSAYLHARNRFVCANLRLVVAFAKRYGRHHTPLADRIQEGNLGLMKAVDRFDPDRGVRFSTYAAWWIRHAITRALTNNARTVRIPAHLQALFTKANGARRRLWGELGREPELDELAAAIGSDPERLGWALRAMDLRTVSLDAPLANGRDGDVMEGLCDDELPDLVEELVTRRDRTLALLALRDLPAKDQDILRHRFELPGASPMTLEQIGRRLGVSRERVRQLQNRALDQLRRAIETDKAPSHLYAAA